MTPPDLVPPETILKLGRIEFILRIGDITQCGAEVLVNSAGTGLSGERGNIPGSVAWAVRRAGGASIYEELRAHEPLVPGDVVVTAAGELNAKYIYHAVVVGWRDEQIVLQATIWRAVSKCMALAQLMGQSSIALPALGTGSGRAQAWETHSTIAAACLDAVHGEGSLRRVYFCFLREGEASTTFRRAFYQQQLIRELRGLSAGGSQQAALATAFENLTKRLLASNADADEIGRAVKYAREHPSDAFKLYVVQNFGSGAIAVGEGAQAVGERGVMVAGDNNGEIATGDSNPK